MRLSGLVTVMLVAACGRLEFEPRALVDASRPSDDATPDAVGCTPPFVAGPTGCHAYIDMQLTWPEARDHCLGLASDLVVILDSAENAHVATLVPGGQRVWVGLTDMVIDQTFVWVDGSPTMFTGWAGGEPNSDLQDCVELTDAGTWNEEVCTTVNPFVCER